MLRIRILGCCVFLALALALVGLDQPVNADERAPDEPVAQPTSKVDQVKTTPPQYCCKGEPLATALGPNTTVALDGVLNFTASSPWVPPTDRTPLALDDVMFTDQAGKTGKLADFQGRPLVVSFFYSRCDNELKCSRTVATAALLKRAIKTQGLDDQVTLLLASFEPEYDTPARLSAFGQARGMLFDQRCRMVRFDPASMPRVLKALDVPVNYNAGWVNIHGVSLYLLDHQARLVRTYHTVIWDNNSVIADVAKLLAEPGE